MHLVCLYVCMCSIIQAHMEVIPAYLSSVHYRFKTWPLLPAWHVSGSADNGLSVLGGLPCCRVARACLAPLSGFLAYCTRRLHGKAVQSCSECAAFPAQQDAATMVERMAPVAPYCKSHGGIGHRALAGHFNCRAGGNHRFGCFHRLFNNWEILGPIEIKLSSGTSPLM